MQFSTKITMNQSKSDKNKCEVAAAPKLSMKPTNLPQSESESESELLLLLDPLESDVVSELDPLPSLSPPGAAGSGCSTFVKSRSVSQSSDVAHMPFRSIRIRYQPNKTRPFCHRHFNNFQKNLSTCANQNQNKKMDPQPINTTMTNKIKQPTMSSHQLEFPFRKHKTHACTHSSQLGSTSQLNSNAMSQTEHVSIQLMQTCVAHSKQNILNLSNTQSTFHTRAQNKNDRTKTPNDKQTHHSQHRQIQHIKPTPDK